MKKSLRVTGGVSPENDHAGRSPPPSLSLVRLTIPFRITQSRGCDSMFTTRIFPLFSVLTLVETANPKLGVRLTFCVVLEGVQRVLTSKMRFAWSRIYRSLFLGSLSLFFFDSSHSGWPKKHSG